MSIAEKFEIIADAVYEKGKQAEYDRFWDEFQQNGNRRTYAYGISGTGWTKETFKPKYDLIATASATFMFCNNTIREDLGEILDELGIKLDTTGCPAMTYMFRTSQFTKLPTIDCQTCANVNYIFANMTYLTTIEKWILPATSSQNFTSAFLQDTAPTDINEIEGTFIASIDFGDCKSLSAESQVNIIKHLKDFSGTNNTSEKLLTIHPEAWERLNQTYAPSEVGIDFDGSWISYVESLGWSM